MGMGRTGSWHRLKRLIRRRERTGIKGFLFGVVLPPGRIGLARAIILLATGLHGLGLDPEWRALADVGPNGSGRLRVRIWPTDACCVGPRCDLLRRVSRGARIPRLDVVCFPHYGEHGINRFAVRIVGNRVWCVGYFSVGIARGLGRGCPNGIVGDHLGL